MAFIFGLTRQYFPHLTPPDYQSITNQKTPKGISILSLTNTVPAADKHHDLAVYGSQRQYAWSQT